MKKWIVALLVISFMITETSCAVRVTERRRRVPPPPRARAVVVY